MNWVIKAQQQLHSLVVDFEPSKVTKIQDNISGIATGNITYTIDFDKDVLYFSSNALTINNGTVASVSGSGNQYTVLVTPDANEEGNEAIY